MLREAVDECADAFSSRKMGIPLLEREIGGDDGGALFVAPGDDVVEHVAGALILRDVADFVENEQIDRSVVAKSSFNSGHRFLFEKVEDGGGECAKFRRMAMKNGALGEVLRKHRFPDAGRAAKEHVVRRRDEVQLVELLIK